MTRVFSLDHKVIGIQYAITSMVFLLIGFTLMMLMRWQLAAGSGCRSRHLHTRRRSTRLITHHYSLIASRESRVSAQVDRHHVAAIAHV
jgi:heme/copper-type cytochrome/quinol oxidase subunit 1